MTNDMLVGLNVPTKLRKSIMGGGAIAHCPPPFLATLMMIAVQGVGEPFMLFSTVLDTNGEGVGGIRSHGGDFLEIWVLQA